MISLHAALTALALSGVGQTVFYDFYSDTCAPCRAMGPTIRALIDRGYPVQRVNIDRNPTLAAQYRVQNVPCYVMVVGGREVDRVLGGTTLSRLQRMCELGSAGPPRNPSVLQSLGRSKLRGSTVRGSTLAGSNAGSASLPAVASVSPLSTSATVPARRDFSTQQAAQPTPRPVSPQPRA
ncbi:hypothetical protein LCGC14_2478230, partial [marine sediment metagenome]